VESVIFLLIILAIWIVPVPLGIRKAKQKGHSPHWMWFGILPIYGWLAFFILCMVPKLKKCANCGEKNKLYAKTCQRCNSAFDESTIIEYKPKTKKYRIIKIASIISMVIVLIIIMFILINGTFKNSEIYKMTLEILNNDPQAQMMLNKEIKSSGFISGSISTSGSSGKADFGFNITGSTGKARVYVIGVKEFDKWKILKLYIKDKELIKIIDEQ
jgi:amino acid transporter